MASPHILVVLIRNQQLWLVRVAGGMTSADIVEHLRLRKSVSKNKIPTGSIEFKPWKLRPQILAIAHLR
jgi:hypothetical protein